MNIEPFKIIHIPSEVSAKWLSCSLNQACLQILGRGDPAYLRANSLKYRVKQMMGYALPDSQVGWEEWGKNEN